MAKYRRKQITEATQWWQNGDHPLDDCKTITYSDGSISLTEGKIIRRFRRPDIDGTDLCDYCCHTMHMHGWIDVLEKGFKVCPGDWIITECEGLYYPCSPLNFNTLYELLEE